MDDGYFLFFLVILTFSLKIYVNGSYFLKSEHFRINVSTYLAQKRIKKYDDNDKNSIGLIANLKNENHILNL